MLCETCLGPNPYLRMVKLPFGHKLCKISNLPYQAFRWKAGPQGRHKETVISYTVACDKNICQTCLNDMKYGLPVGVRDRLLSEQDTNDLPRLTDMPNSLVGQRYMYEQQGQLIESGQSSSAAASFSTEMQNVGATRQLERFSRAMQAMEAKNKTAFRNLPKLCSFWLNGTCNRVTRKVCPFRPCCGTESYLFPEIAGSHRELCAKLIADLKSKGPAEMMKILDAETKEAFRESFKGNKEEAIKKRVVGEDDLTRRYMGKMKSMVSKNFKSAILIII